ncbi:MAG: ArdC-like ssDNA-binding domain-containing protein [bacterium]|nr:ArdC-like ssDNA-binding domain-containing protein [bacterium]
MQQTNEIISREMPKTPYKGSQKTYEDVKGQILERYGEEAAERYDPYMLCRTFRQWLKIGYRVKKGEKALTSTTIVEKRDEKGEVIRKYPKKISLFYETQVEKITS